MKRTAEGESVRDLYGKDFGYAIVSGLCHVCGLWRPVCQEGMREVMRIVGKIGHRFVRAEIAEKSRIPVNQEEE